jgi:hypothetical protein
MRTLYSFAFAALTVVSSLGVQCCNGAVAATPPTADSGADSAANGVKNYVYYFSQMDYDST